MSYAIFLHPQVVKFLRKLPKNDVSRIKAKLNDLRKPHSVKAVKLSGSDAYRILQNQNWQLQNYFTSSTTSGM